MKIKTADQGSSGALFAGRDEALSGLCQARIKGKHAGNSRNGSSNRSLRDNHQ
jgi:hypothetical protein